MKISTKGRYGLRALVDLAISSKGHIITIKEIASRQNISETYLEQIFSVLKKSEILKSTQGSNGGYFLSKPTSQINVKDVLFQLEGDLSIIENNDSSLNKYMESFLKMYVWDIIDKSIDDTISNLTLEDLIIRFQKDRNDINLIYYI